MKMSFSLVLFIKVTNEVQSQFLFYQRKNHFGLFSLDWERSEIFRLHFT